MRTRSSNRLGTFLFMHITKSICQAPAMVFVYGVLFVLSYSLAPASDTLEFEPEGYIGLEAEAQPVNGKYWQEQNFNSNYS
jgi:hypothetical protein